MLDILRLKEFLAECKAQIQLINSFDLVVDDSELVKSMSSHKKEDNLRLLGIIPQFDSGASSDEDSIRHNNHLMFMVLEKTDYATMTRDEKTLMWHRTQQGIIALEKKIIEAKNAGQEGKCPEFQYLDVKSFHIEPVWKLAQCNGWLLTTSFEL